MNHLRGFICLLALAALPLNGQASKEAIAQKCGKGEKEKCIVRYFKDSPEASLIRGEVAFQHYCTLCHGKEGRGDGRAAKLHTPPPANLVASRIPRDYVERMIRKGGEANGRGKGMPPWEEQLTDEQLQDLMNYLFSIRK